MKKMLKILYLFLVLMINPVFANPVSVSPNLPAMQQIGAGQYRYFFWKVYNIELYAEQKPWSDEQSSALKVQYLRAFTGQEIVEETLKQMQRTSKQYPENILQQWGNQMAMIFPDVKPGSVLIAYFDGQNTTIFYNGQAQQLGEIEGRDFAEAFFNIWLGQNSADPKLTQQLLGE